VGSIASGSGFWGPGLYLAENFPPGLFILDHGHLEEGSKGSNSVMEDGITQGVTSSIGQANKLCVAGMGIIDAAHKSFFIVGGPEGPSM
jgi:hypothetical protein